MTKITAITNTNGNATSKEEKAVVAAAKSIIAQPVEKIEEQKPVIKIEPIVAEIPVRKEMTLLEKISRVENLSLVIEKRAKLVQTRSELERFQTVSSDFNCSMRLNDSDGNVFTTSFTPGIKKVVDFLKASFDKSIAEVEKTIEL